MTDTDSASTWFGDSYSQSFESGGFRGGQGGGLDENFWGDDPMGQNVSGSGYTALLNMFSSGGHYFYSGNRNVDAVLIGSRWTSPNSSNFWFSFPTTASVYSGQYPAGTEPYTGFSAFNAQQQAAARYAFSKIMGYANVNFTEKTSGSYSDFRLGNTTYVGSAQGHFPSPDSRAGDMWFNLGQPYYSTPQIGNWGQATIMHELGHALGLKHGHSDYTAVDLSGNLFVASPRYGTQAITTSFDGQAYSLMTYRGGIGQSTITFEGDLANQPQTYMGLDIAALQYLYGANYTSAESNPSNSVYTFKNTTGEMSINGVSQGMPSANKVFRTVWDGGGDDTYYLANYTTNMYLDMNPGGWLVFDTSGGHFQLANNTPLDATATWAPGNVFNAWLNNSDTRSLIENAVGGSGDDIFVSNVAANNFNGIGGNNWVSYTQSATAVVVNLADGLTWDGSVNDALINIQNAIGSSYNDLFLPTYGQVNRINGMGGNDRVNYAGMPGYVFIDLMDGLVGDGSVNDYVFSVENATATANNDFLIGDANANRLDGGVAGSDYIDGGGGADYVEYTSNGRGVIVDLASQLTWDGVYQDRLYRIPNAIGSQYNDVFYNLAGTNIFLGGGGADVFHFSKGLSNGDAIYDFNASDTIIFHGYGAGTLTALGGVDYRVTSQDGLTNEVIHLASAPTGNYVFA